MISTKSSHGWKPRRPAERPESLTRGIRLFPRISTGPLRLHGDVAELCRVVAEEDMMSAAYAIDLLGDLGGPTATDLLLAVLEDPDGFLHHGSDMLTPRAAEALGRLREPRAIPALVELLADFRPYMRRPACHALAEIGDPIAIPALLDAAAEPDHPHGEPAARTALEALAHFDPATVVPALLARLWEYADDGRGPIAVEVLGRLGSPAAIPALTHLATAETWRRDLRRAAALALTHITDLTKVDFRLRSALKDPDPWAANAVAEALARSDRGRSWLASALSDGDPIARQSACHGLGATGDQRFVPVLRDRLHADRSTAVRRAAATALRDIGGPQVTAALLDALGDAPVGDIVTDALVAGAEPPVAELLELLQTGEPNQRRAAARALGRIEDPRSAARLLAVLPGTTDIDRAATVEALGALRHRPARAALAAIAKDAEENDTARAHAILAAARCGDRGVPLDALNDATDVIRRRAAEALGELPREDAVTALASVIGNDSPDIQRAAVESLGRLGRHAEQALLSVLADGRIHGDVRGWAAEQLPRCVGSMAIASLASLAFDDDHAVASAAVTALAGLDDPLTIPPLIAVLSDDHPRPPYGTDPRHVTATEALARFDDPRAIAAIADKAISRCVRQARAALTTIATRSRPAEGRQSPDASEGDNRSARGI